MAAIQSLLPHYSCDVKAFQHIPFARPPTGELRCTLGISSAVISFEACSHSALR